MGLPQREDTGMKGDLFIDRSAGPGHSAPLRWTAAILAAAMVTSPALAAEKTLTVSGDSKPSDCGAAKSASGGSMLTGSLEGCLAIFIDHSNCRPMNGFDLYVELGHEEFEGTLEGAAVKF